MNEHQLSYPFTRYRLAWQGFAVGALPLLVTAAPLLWHQSANARWWGYSRSYGLGLVLIGILSLGLSLWLGWWCQKTGNLQPAFKFLVPFCLLMGAALLTEILLRFTAPDSFREYRRAGDRRSIPFGFEAERQFSWRGPSPTGGWIEYHTDQFGFRVNRDTTSWFEERTNQAGRLQGTAPLVFALGGSSVFGRFLNDDETWAHLLQARLRNTGNAVTVVNAGNWGHNSWQALLRLYLRILPHKPDFLLYYLAYNDTSRHRLAPGDIALQDAVVFSDRLPCYVRLVNAHKNVYFRTMLYYHLRESFLPPCKGLVRRVLGSENYERVKGWLGRQGKSPAVEPGDGADIIIHNGQQYLRNLRSMADMCKRHGTRLVPVTFVCDGQRIDPYVRRSIQHYNELMRQVAQEEGLDLVDMESAFSILGDLEKYFTDDHYHPSRLGAEQMGGVLAKAFPRWGHQQRAAK